MSGRTLIIKVEIDNKEYEWIEGSNLIIVWQKIKNNKIVVDSLRFGSAIKETTFDEFKKSLINYIDSKKLVLKIIE